MTCPKLARLACGLTGTAKLSANAGVGATTLTLTTLASASLPTMTLGESYYINITGGCGCGCQEPIKVTASAGNTLTVTPPLTRALSKGTTIAYASNSVEHMALVAQEAPINIVPPLVWNCETRTLSIDCAALKTLVNNPCAT